MRTLIYGLASALFVTALFLCPAESDASYAANDALLYARDAETNPLQGVSGQRPLYHLLSNAATAGLQTLKIDSPGSISLRILSGLGAALWILLVGSLARSAGLLGLLAALLPILLSRGFLLGVAVGENAIPAGAAATLMVILALRPRVSMFALGCVTVFALLMRQDNVLFVPAAVAALRMRPVDAVPMKRCLSWLLITGLATLFLYYEIYLYCQVNPLGIHAPSFIDWLLSSASKEPKVAFWTNAHESLLSELRAHGAALGIALVGAQSFDPLPHLAAGVAFLVATFSMVLFAPSRGLRVALLTALGLSLLLRVSFFAWVAAQDYECWLPTMMILGALVARASSQLTHGRSARLRRSLQLFVLALSAVMPILHLGATLGLRSRTMAEEADRAMDLLHAKPHTIPIALGRAASTAWILRGVKPTIIQGEDSEALQHLHEIAMAKKNRPAVLLIDRFVRDGQPITRRSPSDRYSKTLDRAPERQEDIIIRRERRITCIGLDLK
jgi:hypothetical protein